MRYWATESPGGKSPRRAASDCVPSISREWLGVRCDKRDAGAGEVGLPSSEAPGRRAARGMVGGAPPNQEPLARLFSTVRIRLRKAVRDVCRRASLTPKELFHAP